MNSSGENEDLVTLNSQVYFGAHWSQIRYKYKYWILQISCRIDEPFIVSHRPSFVDVSLPELLHTLPRPPFPTSNNWEGLFIESNDVHLYFLILPFPATLQRTNSASRRPPPTVPSPSAALIGSPPVELTAATNQLKHLLPGIQQVHATLGRLHFQHTVREAL